jgi:transcriptional regulator with XRE-family HTH domain
MGTRTTVSTSRRAGVPARDARLRAAGVRALANKPAAGKAASAKTAPKKRGRPRKAVNGEEAALGGNVRSTRIIKGLKLRDLADRVGCSESLLSKIENGRASPSVTMLHRIAASLDVTVPALFAARTAGEGMVGRSGERPSTRIDARGSRLERLVPTGAGHSLEGNLHILAPGAGSAGTLAHDGEEVGFVLTGQLELVVDGETHRLQTGDSFVFRSELPHSYRNPGRSETRVVWVSTPPTF